jgi:hypothetical protein
MLDYPYKSIRKLHFTLEPIIIKHPLLSPAAGLQQTAPTAHSRQARQTALRASTSPTIFIVVGPSPSVVVVVAWAWVIRPIIWPAVWLVIGVIVGIMGMSVSPVILDGLVGT